MKSTLKSLEVFDTQTEQELRDIMGGATVNRLGDIVISEKAYMVKYGVFPTIEGPTISLMKYGVYIPTNK